MNGLDSRLLAPHAANDRKALVGLYAEAAEQAASSVARAFYLTHAYVFALETGSDMAATLRGRLVELGSEPASG